MSTITTANATEYQHLHNARPSFFGLVRGEFFKVLRQWSTWILLVLLAAVMILPFLIDFLRPRLTDQIHVDPLHFFYGDLSLGLSLLRVFSGMFLLIVTARMIGLEYQLGTIRVLLSRGVGRLQLLFAKLLTMALIALVLLVLGCLLVSLMTVIVVAGVNGNLNAFQTLNSQFWSDAWTFLLTVLLNMGVTILLAAAAAVVGRSLAFGLSIALVFFPVDNIGAEILRIPFLLTNNDFWLNLTAYFLGPNLNDMPNAINSKFDIVGATPLYLTGPEVGNQAHGTLVDGTHTLVVAAIYAAIFLVVAVVLTWRRDVKE